MEEIRARVKAQEDDMSEALSRLSEMYEEGSTYMSYNRADENGVLRKVTIEIEYLVPL